MRSDNLKLPCVQPLTSSYNFQLPHGRHGHGGHVGHGGRGEHGGHGGHGGPEVEFVHPVTAGGSVKFLPAV